MSILARRFVAALCLCLGAHGAAEAACPPGTSTKFALQVLKQVGWKVADEAPRQALAIALLDCLDSPDPELRDGIAIDAISTWARARALTPATLQTIRTTLVPRLAPGAADDAGFAQPFAALALAEVARADRVQPYLTDAERSELVRAATAYLASVRDYRGFDAGSRLAPWRRPRRRPAAAAVAQPRSRSGPARRDARRDRDPGDAGAATSTSTAKASG